MTDLQKQVVREIKDGLRSGVDPDYLITADGDYQIRDVVDVDPYNGSAWTIDRNVHVTDAMRAAAGL